jgi:hypothetical protein
MKRKVVLAIFAALCMYGSSITAQKQTIEPGGSDSCSSIVVDCPGWGTGDRLICVIGGS